MLCISANTILSGNRGFMTLDKRIKEALQEILERLCNWKGFVIIEGSIQPCAYVFVGTAEILTGRSDENNEGQKCGAHDEES